VSDQSNGWRGDSWKELSGCRKYSSLERSSFARSVVRESSDLSGRKSASYWRIVDSSSVKRARKCFEFPNLDCRRQLG